MAPHRSQTIPLAINFNSLGDNTVIAAVTGAPLNVYGIVFTVTGATNITFKDASTALSGAFVLTGNGSSFTLPMSDEPWFQVQPGDAFVVNSSNAVTVGGMLWYTQG